MCENEFYLYAYDSTLFARLPSNRDPKLVEESLNRDLSSIKSWADKWKVSFEPTKCKMMTISRKRTMLLEQFLRWVSSLLKSVCIGFFLKMVIHNLSVSFSPIHNNNFTESQLELHYFSYFQKWLTYLKIIFFHVFRMY